MKSNLGEPCDRPKLFAELTLCKRQAGWLTGATWNVPGLEVMRVTLLHSSDPLTARVTVCTRNPIPSGLVHRGAGQLVKALCRRSK